MTDTKMVQHMSEYKDGCFSTLQERMRYLSQVAKMDVMRKALGMGADKIDEFERELAEAKEEIDFLRRYGNKDCTAMADQAMKEGK